MEGGEERKKEEREGRKEERREGGCWFTTLGVPWWNFKLVPIPRGQGKTEERGRLPQIGRWQV